MPSECDASEFDQLCLRADDGDPCDHRHGPVIHCARLWLEEGAIRHVLGRRTLNRHIGHQPAAPVGKAVAREAVEGVLGDDRV